MRISAPIIVSCCLIAWQALADEPAPTPASTDTTAVQQTSQTQPAPAQAAVAADAKGTDKAKLPAAQPTAKTASADAATTGGLTEAQIKKFRGMGYKPVDQKGTTYFCRDETALGSRFPQRVCRTVADMEHQATYGQDEMSQMQRQGSSPNSRN